MSDHTKSEQHKSAMMFLHRDQAKSKHRPITSYSPIVLSLMSQLMDPTIKRVCQEKV